MFILPEAQTKTKRKHGGSEPGKRADKERKRSKWGEELMSDYFGDNPTYDARDFRRRFRMRREVFERVVYALVEDTESNYFTPRPDATGLLGFLPDQKVTCALRMLAYGACADQLDELIRIGESTVLETMEKFCSAVMRIFGPEYLRKPTPFDVKILLAENAARGCPGMIGSLDCMHWAWKNCPVAWAGAFKGKERAKTVILEAVASQSLWIWHAFFGTPGSNNDLNVLERSPLLDDLVNSEAPTVAFSVNGVVYDRAYYLTDGIYPAWAIFQQSIAEPINQRYSKYKTVHEAVRKDIARAFGVLQQRFRILAVPCKLWSVNAMGSVVMT